MGTGHAVMGQKTRVPASLGAYHPMGEGGQSGEHRHFKSRTTLTTEWQNTVTSG